VFPPKPVFTHRITKKAGKSSPVCLKRLWLCIKRHCASLLVRNPEYDLLCKNNVQTSSLNVQNSFSDVQNFLSHIQNSFSDVRNFLSDVQNLFSHVQNFLSDIENIFSNIQFFS